jgi:hypothetical protein
MAAGVGCAATAGRAAGSRRGAMAGRNARPDQLVPIDRPRLHNVVDHEHRRHGTCQRSEPLVLRHSRTRGPVVRCSGCPRGAQRLGRAAWPGCWLALVLTVLLAGCVRSTSSVDPTPAPVFELRVTASRPCPTAADPQLACFAVELRNVGAKAGEGTCVVRHYLRDGEALVGEGPSFQARLRPGEAVPAQGQAHLTAPIASLRFNSNDCNPGGGLA